jgi:hypothetical protein
MRGLKTAIAIILLLVFGTAAYSQEEQGAGQKAVAAKEDDRLPSAEQGRMPKAFFDCSGQGCRIIWD